MGDSTTGAPRDVRSQVPELRERKIGITPFDCPYDNSSSGAPAGASARKTVLATGPGATLRCSGALRLGPVSKVL
jgi:hypothetical protein